MLQYFSIFYDYWINPHKVTFNGIEKTITVNYGESVIRVKEDIYSDWKEWMLIQDNSKYLPALRSIGGDTIDAGNGIYAGDIYFLINGWKIVIPHSTQIVGTLYCDDQSSPYIIKAGAGVAATVSNLVQTVATAGSGGGGSNLTVPQIASGVRSELAIELNKVNTFLPVPSPATIAAQVRTELTPELSHITSQVNGLTASQLTMLTEMYRLMGLDPTKPLIVTQTSVDAGTGIHQNITGDANQTIVTRV